MRDRPAAHLAAAPAFTTAARHPSSHPLNIAAPDAHLPCKRHTVKCVFERLLDEHGAEEISSAFSGSR